MLFNSITYWIFLPLIVVLYFLTKQKYRWAILLVASYVFYMTWRMEYALLILFSTAVDYWAGLEMTKREKKDRKPFLAVSLIANLGLLFCFKYLDFFNETIREISGWAGIDYGVPELDILLPVGISFYTFQTLSYTIDVYRGTRKAETHFGIFALYVSFFPQLVAGPIEKSTTLLPQFYEKHQFELQRVLDGVKLIVWGLFKKMVIGDNLAIFVNNVYDHPDGYSGNMLILATYAFTIQVYADFSGYTDIAIGSAKILGFNLSDNFNRPYFATSISKLWRRWHISLTQWIRDYFYLPLLHRSQSSFMSYVLIYVILIVIGLWHGVGWQFGVFGVIHGTYLTIQRLTFTFRNKLVTATKLDTFPKLKNGIDVFITFNLWAFALIFFRSNTATDGFFIVRNIFEGGEVISFISKMSNFFFSNIVVALTGTILLFVIEYYNKHNLRNPFSIIKNNSLRWVTYLFVVFYLMVFRVTDSVAFFYFQF